MSSYDVLVIGGGIAGVSIGYELAADRSVGLLEMEATLAFHTTGRSVATLPRELRRPHDPTAHDGEPSIHGGTSRRASARPLLKPLPLVWVAPHSDLDDMSLMHRAVTEFVPDMRVLSADEVVELTKVIRRRLGCRRALGTGRERDRRRRAARRVRGAPACPRRRDPHLVRSHLDAAHCGSLEGHRSVRRLT